MDQTQPLQSPPAAPTREASEPLPYYRARLLRYILEHGEVFGLMDDHQLEITHYAATEALTRRVVIGPKDNPEATPANVYDHIETIRRRLTTTIARRKVERDAEIARLASSSTSTTLDLGSVPPTGGSDPGHLVKPIPPVPDLPPVGVAIDPYERKRQLSEMF